MGEEVEQQEFSGADRTRYREKVRRNLDVFARMLAEARFDADDPMTGLDIELNPSPRKLREGGLSGFENALRASLNDAETKAAESGAHMVMIGILPTLEQGHMNASSISANPRYKLLSDQILATRGEDLAIDIGGPERLI